MNKKMWGGRFSKKADPLVEEFTKSIQYDKKLAKYDLLGSMAHVQILKQAGFLTPKEASGLKGALGSIYKKVKGKGEKFNPGTKDEDIHTYIQNVLRKKVGDLALKLHTARSRNDQVVFATKLYCKKAIVGLQDDIAKLNERIAKLANKNAHIIIPGFTHMQHAQPIFLKDYLLAYIEMLKRDDRRLGYINRNMKMTLGAGALAGTPISANFYRFKSADFIKGLKEDEAFNVQPAANSIDAVSDRDFVIEIISALSILAMHLSRLSEDMIIWSTKEFGFVELDESFCTGSSLMPQKKNPDCLELIRGYAGRLCGNLVGVLTMMKGLPLTYNRDMQLDKEPLFNSFEVVSAQLKVLAGLFKTLDFNKFRIAEQLKDESLYATDLAYYLVDKGEPFKKAHTIVGRLIKYSIDNSIEIKDIPEDKLKSFSSRFIRREIKNMVSGVRS